ncbi:MAG: ParA family protein [bacterium]|nr:ParA family protein [bacterium]
MARILGVINQKGGTGKTTTSVNLSAYLAALGKNVLLVDLDPQANATTGVGHRQKDEEMNIYHAIIDGSETGAIIKKTDIFGFHVLPAASSLAGATVELASLNGREFRLKNSLNKIRTDYDYIIIDSPPSLGLLTLNGLVASEQLIIPVQCEYYALEGLTQLLETIELVRSSLNPELKIMGVVLTMYDKRNKLANEVVREVKEKFPGHVFDAVVPRVVSLAEAPSFGKTILQFDPRSKGAEAYREIAQEVVQLS